MSETILDQFDDRPLNQDFKFRVLLIWGGFLLIGIVFRISHWPFASVLTIIPPAGFLAYSTYGMLRKHTRTMLCMVAFGASLLWSLYLVYSTLLYSGFAINTRGLTLYFVVAGIWYTGYEVARDVRKNRNIVKARRANEDTL
jgi:hypothetical protein